MLQFLLYFDSKTKPCDNTADWWSGFVKPGLTELCPAHSFNPDLREATNRRSFVGQWIKSLRGRACRISAAICKWMAHCLLIWYNVMWLRSETSAVIVHLRPHVNCSFSQSKWVSRWTGFPARESLNNNPLWAVKMNKLSSVKMSYKLPFFPCTRPVPHITNYKL